MFALTRPPQATRTLRVLAALLGYPAAEMRAHLEEMGELLQAEAALSPARLQELRIVKIVADSLNMIRTSTMSFEQA